MRIHIFFFMLVAPSVSLHGQEKLTLNGNLAQEHPANPIVAFSGSAAPTRGVVDGSSPPPPLRLTVQSLGTSATGASATRQLDYILRLTNTSSESWVIPIDPDLNKMFHACDSTSVQQVGLSVEFKGASGQKQFLSGSAVWSGCPKVKGSMMKLAPGEWITYRGSTAFPQNFGPPGEVTAGWSISDVKFSAAPGGWMKDSKSRLLINSEVSPVK